MAALTATHVILGRSIDWNQSAALKRPDINEKLQLLHGEKEIVKRLIGSSDPSAGERELDETRAKMRWVEDGLLLVDMQNDPLRTHIAQLGKPVNAVLDKTDPALKYNLTQRRVVDVPPLPPAPLPRHVVSVGIPTKEEIEQTKDKSRPTAELAAAEPPAKRQKQRVDPLDDMSSSAEEKDQSARPSDFNYNTVLKAFGWANEDFTDDTPPIPSEYQGRVEEELGDITNTIAASRPRRETKQVQRFLDEQESAEDSEQESETEAEGKSRKAKQKALSKRRGKNGIAFLPDCSAETVKKYTSSPLPDERLDMMRCRMAQDIIRSPKFPHPVPKALSILRPETCEFWKGADFECWVEIFLDACYAATSVLFNTRQVPRESKRSDILALRARFSGWRDDALRQCRSSIRKLKFCPNTLLPEDENGDMQLDEPEETRSLMELVLDYHEMTWRPLDSGRFFVQFSIPRIECSRTRPFSRAFIVQFATFFQAKALLCTVDPYMLLFEMAIAYISEKKDPEVKSGSAKGTQYLQLLKYIEAGSQELNRVAANAFRVWWFYQETFDCKVADKLLSDKESSSLLPKSNLPTLSSSRRVGIK